MSTKRLLGIFAHPDDEGTMSGAMLQYSISGVETGLVCATRGEVGEIADPALATPENLGEVREGEMRAAAEVLGVHNLWFLGYRDSGMAGTPENQDPRSLAQANAAEVVGKLVAIIRQFRPQVMVTFDESGAYGHPDHIAIYRHTTSAFHAAADAVQYPELGPPDELISVRLDVEPWQETKDRSWSMHRTQMGSMSFMAQLPEEIKRNW